MAALATPSDAAQEPLWRCFADLAAFQQGRNQTACIGVEDGRPVPQVVRANRITGWSIGRWGPRAYTYRINLCPDCAGASRRSQRRWLYFVGGIVGAIALLFAVAAILDALNISGVLGWTLVGLAEVLWVAFLTAMAQRGA
jgi:hypothetical protein